MDPGLCWQLVCMYRQMENTSELVDVVRKLGGGRISRRVQQYLLENVVQDEVVKKHPPDLTYTARVLKLVILGAEKDALRGRGADSDDEEEPVLEKIYAEHAKYMEAVSKSERDDSLDAKWCYRTYAYTMPAASRQSPKCTAETSAETTDAEHATDSATTVTREVSEQPRIGSSTPRAASKEPSLSRDPSTIEPDDGTLSRGRANSAENQLVTVRVSLNLFEGGTGCTTWSAGFYLAEFALTNPEIFVGKRVLELGAGAGVLGVVISRLPGVKELILTDGNEETLENLRGNLRLNGVETSTKEPVVARRSNRFSKTGSSILNEQSEVKESSGLRGDKTSSSESAAPSARSDSDGRLKSGRHSVSSGRPDSSWRMEPGESTECCNPDASEGPRFRCEFLDWEDVSEAQLREYDADVILGADVLYDPGVIPDLVRILLVTLALRGHTLIEPPAWTVNGGKCRYVSSRRAAFIATAIRNESTLKKFVLAVQAAGLTIELVARQGKHCFQYCRWMKREQIRLHRITCEG